MLNALSQSYNKKNNLVSFICGSQREKDMRLKMRATRDMAKEEARRRNTREERGMDMVKLH